MINKTYDTSYKLENFLYTYVSEIIKDQPPSEY
jgi:hypothetical protein